MVPDTSPEPPLRRIEIARQALIAIVATAFSLWFMREILPVLVVIVAGLMLAGTVSPLIESLKKRGFKRWVAVLIVFGTGFVVVGGIAALTLPVLLAEIGTFYLNLPHIQNQLASRLEAAPITEAFAQSVAAYDIKTLAAGINVASALSFSTFLLELLGYGFTSVVLAIYFVSDPVWLRGAFYAVVPRRFHVRLARILLRLEVIVGGYIRGQLLTSLLIGSFVLVMLTILGIPNAVALATFAALADVIPFVGGLLATAPPVLLALQKGPGTAGIILVLMIAYQEFESRIIVPRVYGSTLRLPSAAVVVALLIGGKLGGIVGALLALPVAAALRMMVEELRVELPGDASDKALEQARDERAEQIYEASTTGASPEQAAQVAAKIAEAQTAEEAPVLEKGAAPKP